MNGPLLFLNPIDLNPGNDRLLLVSEIAVSLAEPFEFMKVNP